ncbi:unnamed protein product, partial [marine sediment metagenome]
VLATPGRDDDNDGMADEWEEKYGLNTSGNDGGLDPDNDGFTNYEEFILGFNPIIWNSGETGGSGGSVGEPGVEEKESDGVEIIESSDSGVTLELTTSDIQSKEKTYEEITYQVVTIPGYIHGQVSSVGKPQVPMKGVLLGVPSDSSISISVLDSEYTTLSGYNLYPVPQPEVKESESVKYLGETFVKDEATYHTDTFYPDKLAETGYTGLMRDQNVAQIKFYPVHFNPVTGEIRLYNKIRVRLDFASGGGASVRRVAWLPSLFTTPAWADSSPPSSYLDFSGPTYKLYLS